MPVVLQRLDSLLQRLGRSLIEQVTYALQLMHVLFTSVRATMIDQAQGWRTVLSVVSSQIYFTGWQAMPLITVLALASGGVVILQGSANFNIFGGQQMMGNLLVAVVIRELGPLLTALVVVARSGTAVSSEVGNMRANREIEALESMGINPLSYIVFPRVLGGVVSVLCLSTYFIFIALACGFLITKMIHGMPFNYYLDSLARSVAIEDVWLFLLKNTFSGIIIFVIACYQGLLVKKSPTEVPIMTTHAVVKSIIYVIVFNMSVTTLFYLYQLAKLGVI